MKYCILAFITLTIIAPNALAYENIARYKNWTVFKDSVDGTPVCYASTRATDKAPKSTSHGDVVFFVTYFRSSSTPQSSLRVDYSLREDLKAKVIVGNSSWPLYSVRNEAFASNDDEKSIARALRKGSELRVEAVSERNTAVAYHFSLSGSASAIDRARSLCS